MASEQSAATLSILATDSGSALAKFAIAIEARWRLMAARSDPPPPPVAVPAEVALDGRTYCGRLLMDHNIHANVNLHDAPNVLYCWFFGFEFFERLGKLSLNEVYSALGIPANRMTDNLFHHGKRPVLMLAASDSLNESDSVSALTACPGTWAGVERILRVDYSARVADLVVPHLASFRGGVATFEAIQSSVPADDPVRNVELFAGEQFGFWVTLSGRAGAIRFGEHELLAAAGDSAAVAPWLARLFLYCMLRLTGEFHGGGRTLDSAGNAFGPTEWLVKNVPIEKMLGLGGVCVEVSRDFVAFPETMRDSLSGTPYYSKFQNWSRP